MDEFKNITKLPIERVSSLITFVNTQTNHDQIIQIVVSLYTNFYDIMKMPSGDNTILAAYGRLYTKSIIQKIRQQFI